VRSDDLVGAGEHVVEVEGAVLTGSGGLVGDLGVGLVLERDHHAGGSLLALLRAGLAQTADLQVVWPDRVGMVEK
jgi:hypothetical protein